MPKYIIYQLFPRTFTNYCEKRIPNGTIEENGCGKFNFITPTALKAIRELGATHVWLTGVIAHAKATDYTAFGIPKDHPAIIKGKAGSPYAIKDYYDVDPDLAVNVPERMQEFEKLIARVHRAKMKVVLDFVANHVARSYKSLCKPADVEDLGETDHPEWDFSPLNNFYYMQAPFVSPVTRVQEFQSSRVPESNGFDSKSNGLMEHLNNGTSETYTEYPAKATGNDCFTNAPSVNDWYETVKLNYGVFYLGGGEKQFDPVPNTWQKMLDILLFWCEKGVDMFRCDMAEMVPVEFWHWAIEKVKLVYPHVEFLAEVYNPELYKSYIFYGGFDYLYDKVGMYDYVRRVMSKGDCPASGITGQWQATDDIHDKMLYFLENHDEQRIASGFFCGTGIFAQPALIIMTCLRDNPFMLYAGQELGEKGMDYEGFSGIDGRTSIFDYWGVKSLQAWANKGRFDGAGLSADQKELRAFYQKLLNIAKDEKAIAEGKMFDLTYAQWEQFNQHEQFAFLRAVTIEEPHAKTQRREVVLCVVNFDAHPADIQLHFPQEAFDYLELPQVNDCQWINLLTDEVLQGSMCKDKALELRLEPWSGVILKLNYKS